MSRLNEHNVILSMFIANATSDPFIMDCFTNDQARSWSQANQATKPKAKSACEDCTVEYETSSHAAGKCTKRMILARLNKSAGQDKSAK